MLISVNRIFSHKLKYLKVLANTRYFNPDEYVKRFVNYLASLHPVVSQKDIKHLKIDFLNDPADYIKLEYQIKKTSQALLQVRLNICIY